MQDILMPPPPTDNAPPPPPAPPKDRGEPSGRKSQVIIPCPNCSEMHMRDIDQDTGFITFVHFIMIRVDLTTMDVMGHEHICTRTYRQWLRDLEAQYPRLPPHISFGGRIGAKPPDEDVWVEWKKYAERKYAW